MRPDLAKQLRTAAEKIAWWTARRNALIVEARREGSLREVAELAGMTGPGVLNIERREQPK